MPLTAYLSDAFLAEALQGTDWTPPGTVYVSLHTAVPNDGDTEEHEVSGGSYARQSAAFAKVTEHHYHNSAEINFTGMPAATVTHVGLYDAETAGNLLWYGELVDAVGDTTTKTVDAGDTLQIADNHLDVTTGSYVA